MMPGRESQAKRRRAQRKAVALSWRPRNRHPRDTEAGSAASRKPWALASSSGRPAICTACP
eukprot:9412252-Heterocapsa_arctica.AAC.1